VEFGPLGDAAHGVDERVRVADIGPLSVIYERTIAALLAGPSGP
jgi:acetylornithine deacetylase/succinyl-diaminopimelate desuccinylase-like protein